MTHTSMLKYYRVKKCLQGLQDKNQETLDSQQLLESKTS